MDPQQDTPATAAVGDTIEHKMVPGFTMTVLEVQPCETDSARPEPHDCFKITGPDGNEDWLCAFDVAAVPPLPSRTPGEALAAAGWSPPQGDPAED